MNSPLWQYIVTTALSFLGSGLAAAIVGGYLNYKFNRSIEIHKASLARETANYTLQVKALNDLHAGLTRVNSDLATWNLRLKHGAKEVDLSQKIMEERNRLMESFELNRLCLPKDIGVAVDQYFNQQLWLNGQLLAMELLNLIARSEQQDDLSEKHAELDRTIYGPLRSLIRSIDDRSRDLIHGSSAV